MVRTMSKVNSAKSNIYLTHKRAKVGKYEAYERPKAFNDEENPSKSIQRSGTRVQQARDKRKAPRK